MYLIGVDLGQAQDYTAITITEKTLIEKEISALPGQDAERVYDTRYFLRFIERPALGTAYPDIVNRVKGICDNPDIRRDFNLIVDSTGVGKPVIDMLRREGLYPIPILITGGTQVVEDPMGGYHVPKRDLAYALQVVFQARRIQIADGLKDADTFALELQNFRVKIDKRTAHDSYEAWREGEHDDIVLSVAMAVWYGEKDHGSYFSVVDRLEEQADDYDPLTWGLKK